MPYSLLVGLLLLQGSWRLSLNLPRVIWSLQSWIIPSVYSVGIKVQIFQETEYSFSLSVKYWASTKKQPISKNRYLTKQYLFLGYTYSKKIREKAHIKHIFKWKMIMVLYILTKSNFGWWFLILFWTAVSWTALGLNTSLCNQLFKFVLSFLQNYTTQIMANKRFFSMNVILISKHTTWQLLQAKL